ncbi:unnamed protein product, partial [Rotaria magnacalcarata]
IKRKTIVRRVDVDKEYSKPRNIIIQYEHLQVRVVRQFQRYGAQLLDAQILLQQVRAAGVVEDIVSMIICFNIHVQYDVMVL